MNKKFTKLMAALALLVFMTPSLVGWGQSRTETTTTYTFTSKTWGANINGISANWTCGQEGAGFSNNGIQVTTNATGANGTSPGSFTNVTKIVATYNTNKSAGAGTIEAKIGDNNAVTKDWAYPGSGDGRTGNYTVQWDYDTPQTGNVKITCNTTTNSIYLVNVAITTSSSSTDPFCSIDPSEWDFGNVQAGSAMQTKEFSVITANLTDDLTVELLEGTYYSVDVASIGQDETSTTVTVTLNPTAVGPMEDVLMITGGGITGIDVDLTATGLCNAPATALAYTSPVNLTLSGSSVGCTLNPTANTGNGGAITYAITQGDVNHGILVDNEFEADALGTWVVTATQALNGTTCGGTADITINVYGPDQTITFETGSGSCDPNSVTVPQGTTIQLPPATPSQACADAGWTFVGWTDDAVTETQTAPTILLLAGEDYIVTTTEPLYAVYMQGGSSNCSVTFSESGYSDAQAITEAQVEDCATATFDKGTNSNAPKYYNTGTAIRCYGGNTITIAGEALTEIVLTFGSGDGSNTITTNVGSYSDGTWTGSANTVTFTIGGTSGNRRIAGISVTCGGTATYDSNPACLEKVATPVIALAEGTYTEVKTTTITCATEGATIYYTTDGTDPTDESTEYTGAITIGQSMTLKAIAVKENMENSNIASATYTINIQYTLTINNENGNIRDIHVFDNPQGDPILYIDEYSGEELTEASIDAGTVIYVSVGGVVDCKVFDALTVTCGGSPVTPSYDGDMYSFTLNGNTNIAVSATDAEEYTLTVEGLEHVSFGMLVGSESEPTLLNVDHEVDICEQVLVEVTDLTIGNGNVLESVTLTYGDETQTITLEYGVYAFNMPSSDATLTITTSIATSFFEHYSGELTEGDYLIVCDGKAMNTTVSSDRLQYEEVTPYNNGDVIATNDDNEAIVWHIAQSGDYWTIYNEEANAYAASTGAKNKAQMLSDGTNDMALWTVSGSSTYEFVNKYNAGQNVNANLRNNGTYGFACYASNYGNVLSLYKKVTPQNYTTMDIEPNQWYFIASPTGTSPVDVNVLSDLYYYDEQDHHWRNQKVFANSEGFVNFDLGKGYLCANTGESAVTLTFTGVAMTDDSYTVDLDYHATTTEGETNTLAGWNLVGNPFTSEAYIVRDYYVIGNDATTGKSIIVASEGGAIAPYTGVMVQAEGEGESVTFTTNAPENPSNGNLQLTVAQQVVTRDGVSTGSTTIDNAIVSFNEGSRLGKFYFGENDANIYIPQNGKDYAIVSAEAQGEMPVSFRAAKNGTYTLTVNPEGVEMNYLHLIDNMTGIDIDLLQTPNYTFESRTTDYTSRFRLVFGANGASAGSASDETFAYFNGSEWMINNSGNATLQVVDVMGRVLSSEAVNGSVSKAINTTAGVYMLRLVSGNDVKTQKIVVR